MPFELKILDTISCPRCNGKAELRIDQKKFDTKLVLVYIVCPICRLNKYSHTTTRKAVQIKSRIKKLKKSKIMTPRIMARIRELERQQTIAERQI